MNGEYKIGDVVLGNWTLVKLLGEGAYGKVYEAHREEFGTTYTAAIKIMTIPASQSEVSSARAEGMDNESVTAFFYGVVKDVVQEFALMSKLKGTANIVSYEDHSVIPLTDGIGWDILIRMELLTPMLQYMSSHEMTRSDIIKLGIDMCKALELCQRYNIVHRDIKPQNIFISNTGDYKLGDFGVARTMEMTTSGMSTKGTFTYMAPEVYNKEEYGSTVDIYSLGIVLYRLLNNNRPPFMSDSSQLISFSARERALRRRISGEPLPPPVNAEGRLAEIVLKACAYDPKDRYSSPLQMRQELEAIQYNRQDVVPIYKNNGTINIDEEKYTDNEKKAERKQAEMEQNSQVDEEPRRQEDEDRLRRNKEKEEEKEQKIREQKEKEQKEKEQKEKEQKEKEQKEKEKKRRKKLMVIGISSAVLLVIVLLLVIPSCVFLGHRWNEATCTEPKTCSVCGETEGNALGHSWKDATCTEPKICSVCGETEGNALGHSWKDATCTEPKTCSVCGEIEGTPLGHDLDWNIIAVDIPAAKRSLALTCQNCGKEFEKREENLETFVEDDVFIFSAEEFTQRMQQINDYLAERVILEDDVIPVRFEYGTDDEENVCFDCYLVSENDAIRLCQGRFYDQNEKLIPAAKTNEVSIGAIRIYFSISEEDISQIEDYFYGQVLIATILAVDPSLDIDIEIFSELFDEIIEPLGNDYKAEKNGLCYTVGADVQNMLGYISIDTGHISNNSSSQSTGKQMAKPTDELTGIKEESYDILVWVSDPAVELTKKQIEDFNYSNNDGICFNATVTAVDEGDAATQMLPDIQAGADLYCFPQDQFARLLQAEALDPIDVSDALNIVDSNAYSSVYKAVSDNTLYAYPMTADNGYFMYYDKSVIPENDISNLEHLIEDCNNAGRLFAFDVENSPWYMVSFFFATGCTSEWTTDSSGQFVAVHDTFNSLQGLKAAKGLRDLISSPVFLSSSSASEFANGAAIVVSGTWDRHIAEDILGDNMGVAELPCFTVDGCSYHLGSFCGSKLMGVKPQENAHRREALHALAQYLNGEQCQMERFQTLGWGPSNNAAQDSVDVRNDSVLSALLDQNFYAVPQGDIHGGWWDLAVDLAKEIKNASGDDAIQAALDHYQTSINALLS